ncbi:UNVERIFIED_ORG: hypothetical protein M2414_003332 [Rahnella aquatilis]
MSITLQQRFQYWKYWRGFEQAYYKIKAERKC